MFKDQHSVTVLTLRLSYLILVPFVFSASVKNECLNVCFLFLFEYVKLYKTFHLVKRLNSNSILILLKNVIKLQYMCRDDLS